MATKPKKDEELLPPSILLSETIGWSDNGVLRQFHEGQIVQNPDDIKALLQHGARYREVL